jgi:phosphonopyruvate decarboxylase
MIDPKKIINFFESNGVISFYGVPDSLLKNFTSLLEKKKNHFLSSNEGTAVANAIGNYLSTKKLSLVYMQNSGLGNAINPLSSIANKNIYSIPIILMIGWRGQPDLKDEPQHESMGNITRQILDLLKIKHKVINKNTKISQIKNLLSFAKKKEVPVALLVKSGVFKKVTKEIFKEKNKIKRIDFLKKLTELSDSKYKIISTTGFTSRELHYINASKNKKNKYFYMIGGMGHSSSVASGYLNNKKKEKILCIDGDGSMLMHMGALPYAANNSKSNYKYILLNNFTHESVGKHKTIIDKIDLNLFSKSIGFRKYFKIKNYKEIKIKIEKFLSYSGSSFLEVLIKSESISNLTRPKNFIEIKKNFMKNV